MSHPILISDLKRVFETWEMRDDDPVYIKIKPIGCTTPVTEITYDGCGLIIEYNQDEAKGDWYERAKRQGIRRIFR